MDGCLNCVDNGVLLRGLQQQVEGLKDTILAQSRIIGQLKDARSEREILKLAYARQQMIQTLTGEREELKIRVAELESAFRSLNNAISHAQRAVDGK